MGATIVKRGVFARQRRGHCKVQRRNFSVLTQHRKAAAAPDNEKGDF